MLVTRPEPGASETARRLVDLHYTPVIAPLLHVRRFGLTPTSGIAAVLVTSSNALPCLESSLFATTLLAVGDATAARARATGFEDVLSADGDAAALAGLAGRTCPAGASLLLATGRQQGASLAAALRAQGFAVHRRVVYSADPVSRMPTAAIDALQDGRLSAALFLSAETARAFVRLLPQRLWPTLAGVEALAIGSPAAQALRFLPWRRVRVSAKSTQDSMMALL